MDAIKEMKLKSISEVKFVGEVVSTSEGRFALVVPSFMIEESRDGLYLEGRLVRGRFFLKNGTVFRACRQPVFVYSCAGEIEVDGKNMIAGIQDALEIVTYPTESIACDSLYRRDFTEVFITTEPSIIMYSTIFAKEQNELRHLIENRAVELTA